MIVIYVCVYTYIHTHFRRFHHDDACTRCMHGRPTTRSVRSPPNRPLIWGARTVHREDRDVSGGSGLVGRGARVLARVSRGHRVYGERADPFAAPRHHDVGNVAVALASNVDTPPVQRPRDPHRQIALDHGALNGGHLARVRRLVTERERGQLGPDCKFEKRPNRPLNRRVRSFPRRSSRKFVRFEEKSKDGSMKEMRDDESRVASEGKKRKNKKRKEAVYESKETRRRSPCCISVCPPSLPPPSPLTMIFRWRSRSSTRRRQ